MSPDEPKKRGKVLKTYLARITLHENVEGISFEAFKQDHALDPIPTNKDLEETIQTTLYSDLDYFHNDAIGVSVEQV